jgi:hypothetical protein
MIIGMTKRDGGNDQGVNMTACTSRHAIHHWRNWVFRCWRKESPQMAMQALELS